MTQEYFANALKDGEAGWRRVVSTATAHGIPVPALGSSLSYFDALRRDRLPAALIQALRDNFGAHTYQRVDREGSFHTMWAGDLSENHGLLIEPARSRGGQVSKPADWLNQLRIFAPRDHHDVQPVLRHVHERRCDMTTTVSGLSADHLFSHTRSTVVLLTGTPFHTY